jgi:hypothetical protein
VTCDTDDVIVVLDRMSPVTRTGEHRLRFNLQHRLDKAARPLAQATLDRVEPVVEKRGGSFSPTMIGMGIHGSHAMAWSPVRRSNVGWFGVDHPGD